MAEKGQKLSELPPIEEVTWRTGLPHLLHHVHMTVSFLLLFVAYSSLQNLASSIIPGNTGYWCLASLYATLCVTTLLVAGSWVAFFKPKWSLVFGSLCYLSFIVANLWGGNDTEAARAALLTTACVLGFGGAILWAAQGTYLTVAATNYSLARGLPRTASMGLFTGVFFAIFQMSQVIGNLISSFLLSKADGKKTDATVLMYVYIGVASAGTLLFGFLVTEEPPSSEEVEGEEETRLSLSQKLLRSFLLLKDLKFVLMIGVIFYSGIEQAFIFSIFTGKIITPSVGQENIGFIMAVFGAVDTVASLIMGKIADNWGPHIVALTGGFCHLVIMVAYFVGLKFIGVSWFHDYSYLLYLTAGIWAIGDAAFNLFPNYVMSVLFTDNAEAAFATLKFFQALGSVLPFLLGPLLFLELIIACFIGVLIIAFVCLAFLHFFVQPINGSAPQEPQAEAINTTNKISD